VFAFVQTSDAVQGFRRCVSRLHALRTRRLRLFAVWMERRS
jgi:hypothetical protein